MRGLGGEGGPGPRGGNAGTDCPSEIRARTSGAPEAHPLRLSLPNDGRGRAEQVPRRACARGAASRARRAATRNTSVGSRSQRERECASPLRRVGPRRAGLAPPPACIQALTPSSPTRAHLLREVDVLLHLPLGERLAGGRGAERGNIGGRHGASRFDPGGRSAPAVVWIVLQAGRGRVVWRAGRAEGATTERSFWCSCVSPPRTFPLPREPDGVTPTECSPSPSRPPPTPSPSTPCPLGRLGVRG